MPYFSVILPTYNRAHLLSKAIESVLAQTFTDWELLIVDDGSTDTTKELVTAFADERIRYIYQENQERSAARNNGIKQARGAYICFLDSDDYFLEMKLENLHSERCRLNQPNCVIYDGLTFEIGNQCYNTPLPNRISTQTIYEFLLLNPIGPLQMCIPTHLLAQHAFNPALRIGEDVELWLRIAHNAAFSPLNSFQTIAVEHEERSVNLKQFNAAKEQLTQFELIDKSYNLTEISKNVRKVVKSGIEFNQAKHYMFNAKYSKGIIALVKSIASDLRNEQVKHRIYCLKSLLLHKIPHEYTLLN